MPKKVPEMTAIQVKRLTKPGFYNVGGVAGLHLQVDSETSRSWILRATVGAKRRDMGLGGYPEVSLSRARELAREIKEQIRAGVDPIAEKKAAREALLQAQLNSKTFEECARAFHQKQSAAFKSRKHAADWINSLEAHVFPLIGRLPVSEIDMAAVLRVIEPIWTEKSETASRIRQRLEKVLDYARTMGYRRGDNPAVWRGNLDAVLPARSKVAKVRNHPALPWHQAPEFLQILSSRGGTAARALEFAILTAARSGEVRGAKWNEFDLDAATWTVPADRMKAGKAHRVPLSKPAIALLEGLPRHAGSDYVFTAPRGGMLSDMAFGAVIKRINEDRRKEELEPFTDPVSSRPVVPHGFRSTFRDWCSEATAYPHQVAEMALAHTIDSKTEAAYRRGDLLSKRAALMADWGRFLLSPPQNARMLSFPGTDGSSTGTLA